MESENYPMEQPGIAIIGMAGRFPGASNVDEFWANLIQGKETIKHFSDEEIAPFDPAFDELKNNPNFVKAKGIIDDVEYFDASFFGYSPREASLLDPQHRIWLEIAWTAMENSGYCPDKYKGAIGIFAGSFISAYLLHNLAKDRQFIENYVRLRGGEAYQLMTGNDASYLPTRTAYKLNLKGPAINVQTACSTSLVAVAQACQSLFNYESDICIAGGICIALPQNTGYLYQEGAIPSSDGHCRPFDSKASGTVFSNGAGAVILKRLDEALADHDHIYAIIRGYGINNDGSVKVSYTAPSIEGQSQAIAMAHAMAGVDPATITYVEAHGTATPMGDPIEVSALTKAFRAKASGKQFCGLGSIKSNMGHLDAAAGVAGLMKTALSLKHKVIPPTLHFQKPNPAIDFANSPFFVVDKLTDWNTNTIRRAGVSSFGIGGTNSHILLEEAPELKTAKPSKKWNLLLFSAKTKNALNNQLTNLAGYLQNKPSVSLADVAFTLQVGRQDMPFKAITVADTILTAQGILNDHASTQVVRSQHSKKNPSIVFMFPGQGAQYIEMGRELYETEPSFKANIDYCAEVIKPLLRLDIRNIIFGLNDKTTATEKLNQTFITQPALFIIEYSLAKLWMKWGIEPDNMIGHSIGEYTAACLAGVFSLEDALTIVVTRGKLMQAMPSGAMRAVRLSPSEIQPYLNADISLAAHNAPGMTVLSGTHDAVAKLDKQLEEAGVEPIKLHTSHAFHSKMMEPAVIQFEKFVSGYKLKEPVIPFISSMTGTWIKPEEATSATYWAQQLLKPVLFSKGIIEMTQGTEKIFLETGPSTHLSALVKQHQQVMENHNIVASLGHINEQLPAQKAMMIALGKLWLFGTHVNWELFYENETRGRIPLPTYPFERKKYWIDPVKSPEAGVQTSEPAAQPEREPVVENAIVLSRGEYITKSIRKIIVKLSGTDEDSLDNSASFTQLSFDSLFLAQFAVELEREFRIPIKFRQLSFDFPNINSLAKHLDTHASEYYVPVKSVPPKVNGVVAEEKYFSLCPFQPKGSKNPFVMVYGDMCHKHFPDLFGNDQPYYGYHDLGADGEKVTLTQVEKIASLYVSDLLKARPKGPYILGGFSFGGLLAHEMTFQLEKLGHKVLFVLIIDCANPQKYRVTGLYENLKYYLLSPVLRKTERFLRITYEETLLNLNIQKAVPVQRRQPYIFSKYMIAYQKYSPKKINANLLLVRSTENKCADRNLGWEGLVNGEIDLFMMEGDHLSTINNMKNLFLLGDYLKKKLLRIPKYELQTS